MSADSNKAAGGGQRRNSLCSDTGGYLCHSRATPLNFLCLVDTKHEDLDSGR